MAIGSAAAIVGGSLLGGAMNARASRKAAQSQKRQGDAAITEQRRAAQQALGFYEPYSGVAQQALNLAPFLTDSQAQYDWLQNNPLFQASLNNANDVTSKMAAAQGRLSAGDTLMQLQQNSLLASQPLLNRQMNNINNLMNLGYGVSQGQANAAVGAGTNVSNIMQGIGNAQAAGIMGANQGNQQMLGGLVGGLNLMSQGTGLNPATGLPFGD